MLMKQTISVNKTEDLITEILEEDSIWMELDSMTISSSNILTFFVSIITMRQYMGGGKDRKIFLNGGTYELFYTRSLLI